MHRYNHLMENIYLHDDDAALADLTRECGPARSPALRATLHRYVFEWHRGPPCASSLR